METDTIILRGPNRPPGISTTMAGMQQRTIITIIILEQRVHSKEVRQIIVAQYVLSRALHTDSNNSSISRAMGLSIITKVAVSVTASTERMQITISTKSSNLDLFLLMQIGIVQIISLIKAMMYSQEEFEFSADLGPQSTTITTPHFRYHISNQIPLTRFSKSNSTVLSNLLSTQGAHIPNRHHRPNMM